MKGLADIPADFWAKVSRGPRLLLLDYDGTLAPLTPNRENAQPYPEVQRLLGEMLGAGHTRIVIVSGRDCGSVQRLLALDPPPEIWGSHGLERLCSDGTLQRQPLSPGVLAALHAAAGLALEAGFTAQLELKPGCAALHWRGLPETEAARTAEFGERRWQPLTAGVALELRPFDGGLELRPSSFHKGTALKQMLDEAGSEDVALAYLGDDLTDEDAFAAVGVRGLSVLVGRQPRTTRAEYRLAAPTELLEFLDRWHDCAATQARGRT